MSTNQPYLSIENVVKQFGQFTALKNISLAIEKGEFVCFLGPSGCGKTTLLRAIAGLDLPTSGAIFQNDQETTFLPPEKRDFGIVFQSYALFPNLTVQENIAVGLKNQGMSNKEALETVEKWLETIGLPTSGEKFPNQLSGGQQQRVALARALALSPGLLLLDEPLSALDAKVRVHLRNEICKLQRKLGITTIMVTHDQDEALSMADRIVVMNHGVIEQVGTPQEIYQQPATRFVAEFVGSMNFIETSVATDSQVRIAETLMPVPSLTNRKIQRGDRFDLAVRPERIKFVENYSNALPVRVTATEFLGAFFRIDCVLQNDSSNQTMVVDVPVETVQKLNIKAGDVRYVQFAEEGLHGYPVPSVDKALAA
ncbi:putative 2-aminoethylphosphonate ABC transporter ATP-binding protein [Vibrio vulnificus]|nr:putative 2-aminoethylphosphonate ABC transporter ATP-binding protein [Vibrio vulnificus]EIA1298931.1 putative 2-aminoethylphosphonate ABC transporter ATP-binding protein [Vibrio vulnificus]EIV8616750.1 putative 2-aminoethylphosphonate ABC transporter ATP-binding protein [Vibrio vulnificus]EIZ4625272.1 putative 2-aminoethylphosphonate ABC transporter ATP-binding protein [Vibrio vulnificus]EJB0299786.1 putative 2-aminoethylphosphonate ABC transporter ATP-binding protein [Vibrio vulnificus]